MTFSVGEAISFGWETFKRRPGIFIGAFFVIFLVGGGIGFVQGILEAIVQGSSSGASIVAAILLLAVSIGSAAVQLILNIGYVNFYIRAHDAVDSVAIGDLWCPAPFWRFLGLSFIIGGAAVAVVLLGFAIVVGLKAGAAVTALMVLAFVALLIFVLVTLIFSAFLVIERGAGPIVAIRESARMTQGQRGQLFVYLLAAGALNIVGLLALLIGLLVTAPVTALATVHIYRKLSQHSQAPV